VSRDVLHKRVAVVYPHLPHYRYGVFKELDQRIAEVLFVTGGESRDGTIAVIPPGSFRREVTVRNRWLGPFLWQGRLEHALRKFDPDAVVYLGDVAYLSTWVSALLSRLRRRRVYFWTIGWHRPESGIRRVVRNAFYHLAHTLLLYGQEGWRLGISHGFPASRMSVVYNSFASRSNAPSSTLDDTAVPSPERSVVGAVIRLSSSKGLDLVLEAVAHLNQIHGVDACCLLVGEGPERRRLEKHAAALGVDLYLPGAVYTPEGLAAVYRLLDVTLVPRAAGLTVLQSLNEGTPVVTARDPHLQMPEFEAIVDGETGTLTETVDSAVLAEACANWLERAAAEGEGLKLQIQARAGQHWSPESQAAAIVDAIRDEE
jgi:glycosyltransferase involved in cell wall biosynthesis